MNTKIDTTTKAEVVDKLNKLADAIDRQGASQMEDDSMTIRATDRLEARVLADVERIEYVIGLLEAYQDDVFPDAADRIRSDSATPPHPTLGVGSDGNYYDDDGGYFVR